MFNFLFFYLHKKVTKTHDQFKFSFFVNMTLGTRKIILRGTKQQRRYNNNNNNRVSLRQ